MLEERCGWQAFGQPPRPFNGANMSYLQGLLIITLTFVGLVYLFGWVDRLSRRREWDSKGNGAD